MPITIDRNEGWNSGARSRKACSGDCQLEFSVPSSNAGLCVGFNTEDAESSFYEIKHAYLLQREAGESRVYVYEQGVRKATLGTYVSADKFTIRRNGTLVTYLKNNVVLYTSATPSTGTVFIDTSLYAAGDRI